MTDDGRRPIEHVTLSVAGVPGARAFYREVMATLGLHEAVDRHGRAAFGARGEFGIYEKGEEFFRRTHVAFFAPSREAVDRFHAAAVAAGGTSLDGPRPRPEFDPTFYSAYLADPGGNVIEVLFRSPVPFEP